MWKPYALMAAMNLPLYILCGRFFFKDMGEFGEAIVFWIKPEIFSALSGEYWDDLWAEAKLIAWGALCVILTFAEIRAFPGVFAWAQGLFA